VNSDAGGAGWLVKIKSTETAALSKLMDRATYEKKHPVG
jgi:glycine cleavage system H lipoate-binding protein